MKFTPSGGRIVVRAVPCEDDRIAVEVSDSGIGIAAEEIARSFRPFEQAGPRHGGLAGFVEHLVKPITFQRLEAAVERFFQSRRDT